jgi:hypothetical protein
MIESGDHEGRNAMSANLAPMSAAELHPSPALQAQVAELRELAQQFPEPTWDEVRSDWEWLYDQFGTPELSPYLEQLVAVCGRRIVGSDPEDELALRIRLAKEHGCHPERFVISYYG